MEVHLPFEQNRQYTHSVESVSLLFNYIEQLKIHT
jgi:hypothetical protein